MSRAASSAGIHEPIVVPVIFGDDAPLMLGDGFTPNLTGAFEPEDAVSDDPGDWHLRPKVVIADERHGVVWFEWRLDGRPGEASTDDGMAFFEFADGLITRITDFWPESFEPPSGREHLVERW